ncbi:hypothetical protein ANOBCDAF_04463 [Pleomorphomonas sp. T1.2MG-36]|uniref:DUF1963 domain-containing protein n=1 Tax=Pleomorphomonas sp. T1.2MG-36 TaxID=3041167 RepID=UPI00247755E3|nr:DUF1963 domain-containing protein [Pleomorphomonas sp. T1.2MG-36]CAI9403660.1 hypothetical protein ANOBCDAF_04463 [Pleomorphomonas sp. T1.2MG-36]
MIGKMVVLCIAAMMSLSAPAIRPAFATGDPQTTSSGSTISGFFSRKLNMFTHPSDAAHAGKETSVILKRQVPIRFGEASRSWLGGLPMMPESAPWPRAANGAPLHFIAQIDCADLPANLWNGLGPRKGWLLLFVDILQQEDLSADGAVQVLHVDQLGVERQPPEDMSTVRHAMSDLIGYEAEFRPGVPKMWRKWPVDLVAQDYTPSDEEEGGPPPVSGEELYGAPADDRGMAPYEPDGKRPLTWRGALYFVEGIVRDYKRENFVQRSQADDWMRRVIPRHEPDEPLGDRDRQWFDITFHADALDENQRYTAADQRLTWGDARHFVEGTLRDLDRQGSAKWGFAEELLTQILAKDLDAPLTDADWQAIETTCRAKLAEADARRIYIDQHLKMAVREDLIDAYVRASGTGPSVPDALLADVEARLRSIYESRPHRMGGHPRRVQPDSGPVPDGSLLFQMGSDDAMGWSWGDAGALYVTMSLQDLQQGRFDRVNAWIEGY